MEKNPPAANRKTCEAHAMNSGLRNACVILFVGMLVHLPGLGITHGGKVSKSVQNYITDFKKGVAFTPDEDVDYLVKRLRFDNSVIALLAKELAVGGPVVRENIVKLLAEIGLRLDTPAPDKFRIVRDHRIIKALLVEGLAQDDAAADQAISILRQRSTPADLAAFREIFIAALQRKEGDYLSLTAKAKVLEARPLVQELAAIPEWRDNEADFQILRITLAALGDTLIEDEYIRATFEAEKNAPPAPANRFYNVGDARDGKGVAAAITLLGYIGTSRSLLVACSYLRSPLKSYVPEVSERSVRYAALDAIRYNYPDERVLHRPVKVTEWAAAEKFCTKHLGAKFDGPTPDLPIDQAFPTRPKK